jgi:flavin-dependent dehydrogenase
MSRVFGMGDLIGHWRKFVTDAGPAALDYFAVGDALVRTNPLFGRGCSFAAVAAFLLADVLRTTRDLAQRPAAYQAGITAALRPYYEAMRNADRQAIRRAAEIVDPSKKKPPTLAGKLMRSFGEDGAAIAIRSDPVLFRAAMRDFHMLDKPGAWMRNPANIMRILRWWSRGKTRNADRYPPKQIGPERAQMFGLLGLA